MHLHSLLNGDATKRGTSAVHLHPDWKLILRRAWSVRLLIVAAGLSGVEAALPYLYGFVPLPPALFALAMLVVVAAAFAARLVAQDSIDG
jgi:hypothetical protein